MKNKIAFVGLVLILVSSDVLLYRKGLVDGKEQYRESHSFALTLDSQYHFGFLDGKDAGRAEGWELGLSECVHNFMHLSKKEKKYYCK